jgi:hypothetical protein
MRKGGVALAEPQRVLASAPCNTTTRCKRPSSTRFHFTPVTVTVPPLVTPPRGVSLRQRRCACFFADPKRGAQGAAPASGGGGGTGALLCCYPCDSDNTPRGDPASKG